MGNIGLLMPEFILIGAGILLLLGESIFKQVKRTWLVLGSVSLIVCGIIALQTGNAEPVLVMGMASVDPLARFFKIVLLAAALLTLWLTWGCRETANFQFGTYAALALLATAGMFFLVSAADFILMFVALELISISSFILAGFGRDNPESSEAAIKFFLVGALASSLMIYGISLLYGSLGATSISALTSGRMVLFALIFILAGLGFKLALVPFHMWVPDTYSGSPTPITAFLSVAPKGAALGFLVRALSHHADFNLTPVLAVLAALTMTWGNLAALRQTNVKRLLAYSTIAHVGYIMVGFVAGEKLGTASLLLYITVYVFMNMGAFVCAIGVYNREGTYELAAYKGLAGRTLGLSLILTVFLLSLTGIPPLAGFTGKFMIFTAAISEGWLWLAIVGVLNSVVSLYYYFKIAHNMFFLEAKRSRPLGEEPEHNGSVKLDFCGKLAAGVSLAVTVLVGIFPQPFLRLIQTVVGGVKGVSP